MTFSVYVNALRKRWWLVVVLALVAGGVGFLQARAETPMYRSTAGSYVTLSTAGSVSELVQGSTYTQNLIQSFALLSRSPAVLAPVIEELGLDTTAPRLARNVSAGVPLNSFIIETTVVGPDPEEAAEIANSIALNLADAVSRLSPATGDGGPAVRLEVITPATAPARPYAPNVRFVAVTWAAVGALVGATGALIWAVLDTRLRTEREVTQVLSLPVLGAIPRDRRSARGLELSETPSEAFRRLRTSLRFLDVGERLKSVVVTSPAAGEGKTTTALSLATALAEVHDRVLVIDADLRRPTVAERTGLIGDAGLTSVLIGQAKVEDVVQPWGDSGVWVVASGPVPPNPGQLVESDSMKELLKEATREYDFVVIDAPPVVPVMDAAVLSRVAGGALLVARLGKTTRSALTRANASLESVGGTGLGLVLLGGRGEVAYYGTAPAQLERQAPRVSSREPSRSQA